MNFLLPKIELCQEVFKIRKKSFSRINTRVQNLPLRGFFTCHICGRKLTGSNSRSRNGKLHSYYHCQNTCKERFRADFANKRFLVYLNEFEIKNEVKELYLNILNDVFKKNDHERLNEKKKLETQIDYCTNRIDSLNDKFVDNLIDSTTYKETKNRYESEKNELISKHVQLQPEGVALKNYLLFAIALSNNLSRFYDLADFSVKRQIVSSIFIRDLIFDGESYRTNQVNEAFELIFNMNRHLKGPLKEKVGKIADLSSCAPPTGLEPVTL